MISIPSVCHLSEFKSSDVHIANKIVSHLYKPVDDALLVEETLRRCDMVGGDGGAASVFVFRPGIYDICKIDQVPDPEEILTLRTFLKGFTCNLTLSHFLGRTRQKKHTVQCFKHFLFMIVFKRVILGDQK